MLRPSPRLTTPTLTCYLGLSRRGLRPWWPTCESTREHSGQASEGKGRRGRRGLGMRGDTRKGKGEVGADRGGRSRRPNARSGSRRRGRARSSVRPCGRSRRGRRAASRRRDARRWRTWSARAVATSPQSQDQTPSIGWRWGQGGQCQGARENWRGWEGSTAEAQ